MAKAKASGFKGYTAEEVEEEGKKDLLVLKEMLGEQQVRRCFDLYIFLETYIFYNEIVSTLHIVKCLYIFLVFLWRRATQFGFGCFLPYCADLKCRERSCLSS